VITEIQRRAAKAALKDFHTTTLIPKIARDPTASVDKILMEYKRNDKDFQYIIWNGDEDIKVSIKRMSEGNNLPYRNLALNVLGAISPIKT